MLNSIFGFYKNKSVLVTGSSGFKGSWICLWLSHLGAKVTGYSLEPPTIPSLFEQLKVSKHINQIFGDLRDTKRLKKCILDAKPDFIFHLAAQPLVRLSYEIPIETFDVNIMGTAYLLDTVRQLGAKTNIVCITSDKSYENQEWLFGYRENDAMGGYDPYSASKGAAELIINSFRRSFFNPISHNNHKVKLASARAGNVIGGGDWASDRIVPDCIKALQKKESIFVRSPLSTRPWQHVLEPLGGYLLLGMYLDQCSTIEQLNSYCSGFNFGPLLSSNKNVGILVDEIIRHWKDGDWFTKEQPTVHEASLLNLATDKSYHLLNWLPMWNFEETVKETIEWYRINHFEGEHIEEFTVDQIKRYDKLLTLKTKKSERV